MPLSSKLTLLLLKSWLLDWYWFLTAVWSFIDIWAVTLSMSNLIAIIALPAKILGKFSRLADLPLAVFAPDISTSAVFTASVSTSAATRLVVSSTLLMLVEINNLRLRCFHRSGTTCFPFLSEIESFQKGCRVHIGSFRYPWEGSVMRVEWRPGSKLLI